MLISSRAVPEYLVEWTLISNGRGDKKRKKEQDRRSRRCPEDAKEETTVLNIKGRLSLISNGLLEIVKRREGRLLWLSVWLEAHQHGHLSLGGGRLFCRLGTHSQAKGDNLGYSWLYLGL